MKKRILSIVLALAMCLSMLPTVTVAAATTAGIAMQLPADTTLVLNGTNTVTSTYNGSNHTYGIYTKGSMTVDGTGSLNAMGGLTSGEFSNSCGVYASGSITFEGGKLTV